MTILSSQSILPEFIKLRWQEPYVSSALNRKSFKTMPRGVYNGFVIKAGPGPLQVSVVHNDPQGWAATSGGYAAGDFDTASGWSIAVHASNTGFTTNIIMQYGPGQNFVFDVSAYVGQSIFAAISAQYVEGAATQAQVVLVRAADLDADPSLLSLGRIDVPGSGPVTDSNVHYDDPTYPRVLPFADPVKYGFMSPQQASFLDFLRSVSGSPAFDYEYLVPGSGPQTIPLPPGSIYTVGSDDLWVFKNGIKQTKGASRDYVEVDRGDGHGVEISWVGNIKANDRVELRIQQYAGVLTSTTQIFDEHALIEENSIFINFTGAGVQVYPDGPRAVRVVVPGGSEAGKVKVNGRGYTIPAFRCVRVLPDNTIDFCNPTLGHKFYGVTLVSMAPGGSGAVQSAGTVMGATDLVSGFAIGDDLFVSFAGDGTLVNVPPDPTSGSVIRIGFADGPDGVSGTLATDIVFERGRLT